MKKYFLIAVALCGIFMACKKSSTLSSPGTAINYKLTDAYYIGGGLQDDPVDIFYGNFDSVLCTCQRKNIYSLYANGMYKISNPDTTCNKAGSASGNWLIMGNNLVLIGKDTITFIRDTDSTLITGKNGVLKTGDHLTEIFTQQ